MKKDIFQDCNNEQILSLCIYGEARGEGIEGMLAVASVIMTRAKVSGQTIKQVCLQPKQFSCFNSNDPNSKILERLALGWDELILTNKHLRQSFWIAKGVIEEYLFSNVGEANHYHADSVSPSWNKSMTRVKQIGRHIFWWDAKYARRKR